MFGFLNVNKPPGKTSRDVVNHVQRIVRPAKAGHAGTLDPLASGVLVVAVGPATRLIEYVQRSEKRYRATFLLGRSSDTEDVVGAVVELDDAPHPSRESIERALPKFVGRIEQRPPAYSALKVEGKRAYKLARSGTVVELPPRPVVVHEIRLLEYEYPQLEIEVACGAGTYIRSLGRDIAESMGTAAVMSALVRTAVGEFTIDDSCALEQITRASIGGLLQSSLSALSGLPVLQLTEEELERVSRGMSIANRAGVRGGEVAALDPARRLASVLVVHDTESLRPVKNFLKPTAVFDSQNKCE